MKAIGKAKGKKSKTWCLIRDTRNGIIYLDYVGDWPINGTPDLIKSKVAEAFAARTPQPLILPKVPHPGMYRWEVARKGQVLTPEQEKALDDYDAVTDSEYKHRMWAENETLAHLEPIDNDNVYEAELRFVGYTRGRSSVTMQFEAENGQILEFGPSGINGLIQSMIEGKCPNIPLSGTYTAQEWVAATQEWVDVEKPREKGIKATFKFVKKGQNVYAELVEEWV